MRIERSFAVGLACVLAGSAVWAQVGRGGSEWLTAQGDAQRTGWIRSDAAISLETMSKPGFELQWQAKLDNTPRGTNTLYQGVTANGVTLFIPMSVVAGSSNEVSALDNDTGYVVWTRRFEAPMPAPTPECPGGITASATRIVGLTPPAPAPARGAPRGGAGYHSLLGEPGDGVPLESRGGRGRATPPAAAAPGRAGAPAAPPPPPPAGGFGARGGAPGAANAGIPGAPNGGGPGGGYGRPSGVVYAMSSDGMLHVLGLPSGKDIQQPAAFLPANARWSDPLAIGTTLYAATSGGCGNAPSGVWAIDLESPAKPVTSWKTSGGDIVGRVAATTAGTLLVAVGGGQAAAGGYANAIVALDAKTLQVTDWFTQPSAEFVTGPTVFRDGDREIVAAATKDGRVLLLDAAALGGANHGTPLYASSRLLEEAASFSADTLATWQEADTATGAGTRWILVPVNGAVAPDLHAPAPNGAATAGAVLALKVGPGATPSLEPGWLSHNLVSPAPPLIVNGVVFALSSGKSRAGAAPAEAAVLHAYAGATGQALWSSGRTVTTAASERSLWSAAGQVYVGAANGTVYAFGFVDERR